MAGRDAHANGKREPPGREAAWVALGGRQNAKAGKLLARPDLTSCTQRARPRPIDSSGGAGVLHTREAAGRSTCAARARKGAS